jgi:phenylalanyl-tRNA synthetase beta chain
MGFHPHYGIRFSVLPSLNSTPARLSRIYHLYLSVKLNFFPAVHFLVQLSKLSFLTYFCPLKLSISMTISYNWLSEYINVRTDPKRLSEILTAIGLEVESMEKYEAVKGSLNGLLIGEVVSCEKHPNADKLTLTRVNTGGRELLQIVCGAPNVAIGQKVIVAPVGVTIYPASGEPLTMKAAKIRGVESQGMICAEDEIGLGESHAGIIVLPDNLKPGDHAADYYKPYTDIIYEIGLTPNRMDAMSHLGVARDVAAYLNYHDRQTVTLKSPYPNTFPKGSTELTFSVTIENKNGCRRYAGVSINGVTVRDSPSWLKDRLKAVGVRSINNIVDITNYILHETGQPLHAFDASAIKGGKVIVKNLPEGSSFISLDEKERKLSSDDVMICDAEGPMCIAGVFGGLDSGVKPSTNAIFLESAWFNPVDIRKTSFRHGLRTDAATRFEKGIDISNTVNVLQRAALMITELAGGSIASPIIDVYPEPKAQTEITLTYEYLKKLSGKSYSSEEIVAILSALGFEVADQKTTEIRVKVPYHKMDVTIPADLVEEILRIDGYDNVKIPAAITITPAVQQNANDRIKEKATAFLTGSGFSEILTNSITNSAFFTEEVLNRSVKMLNSLSAELDLMRPSLVETGLQAIAYNLNRRTQDLAFFDFGRSYSKIGIGKYLEEEHLAIYTTGRRGIQSWKAQPREADFFAIKGLVVHLLGLLGIAAEEQVIEKDNALEYGLQWMANGKPIVKAGAISNSLLTRFDIRQPVFFADFHWDAVLKHVAGQKISFKEIAKQLPVHRDLSMIVPKQLQYEQVRASVNKISLKKLKQVELFDVFESDKLGAGKKSMAISFNFLDEEKTLTDKEIDGMMAKIISSLEKDCEAEIRSK